MKKCSRTLELPGMFSGYAICHSLTGSVYRVFFDGRPGRGFLSAGAVAPLISPKYRNRG